MSCLATTACPWRRPGVGGADGDDERVLEQLPRRGPVVGASRQAPAQEVLGLRGQPPGHLQDGVRVRTHEAHRGEHVDDNASPRRATSVHLEDGALLYIFLKNACAEPVVDDPYIYICSAGRRIN
jgi:hypothetical protein